MGLDMYLEKREYVKNWNFTTPEERYTVTITRGNEKPRVIEPSYIVTEAAYWRKANAIHKWFVDNVQNGEDDCKEYRVDIEQLNELLETIETVLETAEIIDGKIYAGTELLPNGEYKNIYEDGKILKDYDLAVRLLPTTDGFFFGGTDYDEYYVQDLEYTRDILEKIIKDYNESSSNNKFTYIDFYYHSSW